MAEAEAEAEAGVGRGKVEVVDLGVGAEGTADEFGAAAEEGVFGEAVVELATGFAAAFGFVDGPLRQCVGEAAVAAGLDRGREAYELAPGVVDVAAPALAEERFADGVADAAEADGVAAAVARGHLLEGGVGEAALALVQGFGLLGLLFVQLQGGLSVGGFLLFEPAAEEWLEQRLVELVVELLAAGFFQDWV